jgi:hypothetical protein
MPRYVQRPLPSILVRQRHGLFRMYCGDSKRVSKATCGRLLPVATGLSNLLALDLSWATASLNDETGF